MIPKNIYSEEVCHWKCSHKINDFIAFLVNDRDGLVKQSIETAIKICEKQEIPIEKRRVQRKKKMTGKHSEEVSLSAVEEIKRCMHARSYEPISE